MSKQYFYNGRKGSQKGPFTLEEIHVLAVRGTLKPKSLIFDNQGKAYDAGEVVDFNSINKSKNSKQENTNSRLSFWLQTLVRVVLTGVFLAIAAYFYFRSDSISKESTEIGHFQLVTQYQMTALIGLGFATITWFVSKT